MTKNLLLIALSSLSINNFAQENPLPEAIPTEETKPLKPKKETPNEMDVFAGPRFGDWISTKPEFNGGTYKLPVGFGYDYRISKRLSLGIHVNFGSAESREMNYYSNGGGTVLFTYNYKMNYTTFQTRLNWAWLIRDRFYVYSGISAGYIHEVLEYSDSRVTDDPQRHYYYSGVFADGFALQLCFLGTKMMVTKRFGLMTEFGAGSDGYFKAGLLWRVK